MIDPRVQRWADLLVGYCVAVQPGEWTLINTTTLGLPLAQEVYRSVLRAGGNPTLFIGDSETSQIFWAEASDTQLQWVSPLEKVIYEQIDALIGITAIANTRAMSHVDPKKQAVQQAAWKDLFNIFMQRSAEGKLKWTGTQYPTQAAAQEAEMSLSEYEAFVFGATFCDRDDPVAEWGKLSAMQQKKVDWLVGKKQVTVKSANCDLTLSIAGRTWINSDGKKNMPSGEIFTGPVEDSANGWVRFTFPANYGGRSVEGVELRFAQGKVVKATAAKNEEFLLSQINLDEGASYLGEFAIGTNFGIQKFTGSILFDEKIGGTIHMALGSGYPETGSRNKSSIHWDMVCDMRDGGEIHVDGELFYKDGQFVV